ncbi:MAG: DUF1801 domain-containing protein [Flavobacteriales bacterium]
MEELSSVLNWFQSTFPELESSFHDGKNEHGKQVTNPTYGFGTFEQSYANGEKNTHFQIGIAQTKQGISIYLLGIRGKLDLPTLCAEIGKAKVTGYCIQFKRFSDVQPSVLETAIRAGVQLTM